MTYRWILFFFLILTGSNAVCQLQIDWQQSYGGSDEDISQDMVKLQDGYLIIGSTSSADSPVSYSHGSWDIWIIRIDSLGNTLWEKTLGGSDIDFSWSAFQATGSPDIFILGGSSSTDGDISSDPYPGIYNNWLMKISENGDIIWNKKFGTPNGMIYQKSGLPTSDGGLICSAMALESGGCVASHYGESDGWVAKIDSLGEIEWELSIGSSDFEAINGITPTPDGGYIAAMNGYSNDSTGNVKCNCRNNSSDAIIFKIDSLGKEVWQHCYGGSEKDLLFSIAPCADGYIAAGGTASSDGDLADAGYHDEGDIWIFRIDLSGNLVWSKCFGGYEGEGGNVRILPTPDGKFMVFGITDSRDGDVTGNATYWEYEYSIWAFKIDDAGHLLWQQCIGGTHDESFQGVTRFGTNRYALSGEMEYSPSCDVNCSNFIPETGFNFWEFVLTDVTDSTVKIPDLQVKDELMIYPNPTQDKLHIRLPEFLSVRDCKIELADVRGRILLSTHFSSGICDLDVHEFTGGFYFLKCSVAEKMYIRKILIR
jgi:hypothetical protein